MSAVMYRYIDERYAPPVNEFDEVIGVGKTEIVLLEFQVLKTTPCGCWVSLGGGRKRLVLNNSTKKFACETREKALESFKYRKKAQARIYAARLEHAEKALRLAEAMKG